MAAYLLLAITASNQQPTDITKLLHSSPVRLFQACTKAFFQTLFQTEFILLLPSLVNSLIQISKPISEQPRNQRCLQSGKFYIAMDWETAIQERSPSNHLQALLKFAADDVDKEKSFWRKVLWLCETPIEFGHIEQRYGGTLHQLLSMKLVASSSWAFCCQSNWGIAQSGWGNKEPFQPPARQLTQLGVPKGQWPQTHAKADEMDKWGKSGKTFSPNQVLTPSKNFKKSGPCQETQCKSAKVPVTLYCLHCLLSCHCTVLCTSCLDFLFCLLFYL